MSPFVRLEPSNRLGSGANVPVLLQHGTDDPMVKVTNSRELAALLVEHGVPPGLRRVPDGPRGRARERAAGAGMARQDPRRRAPVGTPARAAAREPGQARDHREFETEVLRSDVPVIVDFWAPWCGPCRQVGPVVEQIAMMRKGAYKVVKVNIDEEPTLAQRTTCRASP